MSKNSVATAVAPTSKVVKSEIDYTHTVSKKTVTMNVHPNILGKYVRSIRQLDSVEKKTMFLKENWENGRFAKYHGVCCISTIASILGCTYNAVAQIYEGNGRKHFGVHAKKAQAREIRQELKEQGLSDEQIKEKLTEQGLSDEQINKKIAIHEAKMVDKPIKNNKVVTYSVDKKETPATVQPATAKKETAETTPAQGETTAVLHFQQVNQNLIEAKQEKDALSLDLQQKRNELVDLKIKLEQLQNSIDDTELLIEDKDDEIKLLFDTMMKLA